LALQVSDVAFAADSARFALRQPALELLDIGLRREQLLFEEDHFFIHQHHSFLLA
jgi:hypothetical protein